MVTTLMMSAQMTALGLLDIKVFRYKVYDVITSVYEVINKNSSCDLNFIVNVVM